MNCDLCTPCSCLCPLWLRVEFLLDYSLVRNGSLLCGHHETMHSAESRNQFSWNINTRALPQGSQHPKPALTQHKDSPCGYPPGRPSCSHWIESFWAHPAAYWPALSHPWGKTGTVQTQLPLWVRKEEIIKSWASLFMSEILKHHRASLNDEPCTQTK